MSPTDTNAVQTIAIDFNAIHQTSLELLDWVKDEIGLDADTEGRATIGAAMTLTLIRLASPITLDANAEMSYVAALMDYMARLVSPMGEPAGLVN